jgi:hypothetical protein
VNSHISEGINGLVTSSAKYEENPVAPPSGVFTQLFAVVQAGVEVSSPQAPPVRIPPMSTVRQLAWVRGCVDWSPLPDPMLASNTYGARSV